MTDVLTVQISRLMSALATPEHKHAASELRDVLATYRASEDLISIGAYGR